MKSHNKLKESFELIRNQGENIIWLGQPNKLIFILSGVPFLFFGCIWGAIDYFVFIRNMGSDKPGFTTLFFLIHLFPFWGSILNMARLIWVHSNTSYAVSDKRLLLKTGFWGTDFRAIDFNQIGDIMVNVNPIENIMGLGSIRFSQGRTDNEGSFIYNKFFGIPEPYVLFKKIKEFSLDLKIDQQIPNNLRPDSNLGCHSAYKEGKSNDRDYHK